MKNIIYLLFMCSTLLVAQETETKTKITHVGIHLGIASQNVFPLHNDNYSYNNTFIKFQYSTTIGKQNKFNFELLVEPSIYFSHHQLLNPYFIKETSSTNYLEQRAQFMQPRTFEEYTMNIGIMASYPILNNINVYALASIGPMWGTKHTERLKKGFAFSDIIGIGLFYEKNYTRYNLRCTLRHNSNANLAMPNNGHNSVGIETGVSFALR